MTTRIIVLFILLGLMLVFLLARVPMPSKTTIKLPETAHSKSVQELQQANNPTPEEDDTEEPDLVRNASQGYCPKGKIMVNKEVVERSIREMQHQVSSAGKEKANVVFDVDEAQLFVAALQHSQAASTNYQDRLALASQYKIEGARRLDLLDIPMPDSKQEFADSLRLLACIQQTSDARCKWQAIDNITKRHAHNGLIWFRAAQLALKVKDYERFEQAIAQAANAPVFESFWAESVGNLQQSYQRWANATQFKYQEAFIGNYSSVLNDDYGIVFEHCKTNALTNSHTAALCSDLGARMESISNTYIELSIGVGLQRTVAEQLGEQALVAELEKRTVEARSLTSQHGWLSTYLWESFDFLINDELLYALLLAGERGMLGIMKNLYEEKIGPLPECA